MAAHGHAHGAGQQEWEKHFDDETGTPYFHNRLTGETSWAEPGRAAGGAGVVESVDPATGHPYYTDVRTGESTWHRPQQVWAKLRAVAALRNDSHGLAHGASSGIPEAEWAEHTDPATGHPYFINRVTGESRWEVAYTEDNPVQQYPPASETEWRGAPPPRMHASSPPAPEPRRGAPPSLPAAAPDWGERGGDQGTEGGRRLGLGDLHASLSGDAEQAAPPPPGCCMCGFRKRGHCCLCCWLSVLVIGGLLAFIFWPRCLTVAVRLAPPECHLLRLSALL